jgi:predicted nucleic-acid-binding protein
MIAVDTNIIVRYLVEDDVAQTDRAEAMLRGGAVLILKTVILETEWVLRSTYRLDRKTIAAGLTKLLGLPAVVVEDGAAVARALAWFERGLGFADAIHLASSGRAEAFATFDRALQRDAANFPDATPVIAP